MAKLYFKYGAMGASKTAQLLTANFNYKEKGQTTLLLKPATDTRDGVTTIKSRIGISAEANVVAPEDNILEKFREEITTVDAVIVDECQFMTPAQINQLREIVDVCDIPVMCYGLRTDFQTHLFPGSRRLMEVADKFEQIKTICQCGRGAQINARLLDGEVIFEGEQVMIGGNESYDSMCHRCWAEALMKKGVNVYESN